MEAPKDRVRRCVERCNSHDLADTGQIAAVDDLDRAIAPFGRVETGQFNGPAPLRDAAEWLIAQFPDSRVSLESTIAGGNGVAARPASTGTNLGPIDDVISATGRSFSTRQSRWFRVRDRGLAEHWVTRDDLGTTLRLGVIPAPGGAVSR